MKRLALFFLSFILFACQPSEKPVLQLSGSTMGTQYHISIVVDKAEIDAQALQAAIDHRLAEINQEMSTYIDDSEISRFNQYQKTDAFPVSKEFLSLVKMAKKAYQISDGAFEPSIYPIVYLWGFAKQINNKPPTENEIKQALQSVGLQHLSIQDSPPALSKDIATLSLDLSAIAKGYGVDVIADLLNQKGFKDYLVEIGGEVYASGHNHQSKAWNIAIEQPDYNILASPQAIQGVKLSNQAIATSGDYRNYYEYQGQRYAHTMNPKTGKPAKNKLASVSVIHHSTAWADAMATTIMVLGVEKGLAFANKEKLAVFMIIHHGKGYKTLSNRYFQRIVQN